MAIVIKHAKTSPKLDGPDATVVRPSDWNADHVITGDGLMVSGQIIDYIGHTIPSYLLECYGQSVSAATYPTLFATLVKQAVVTLTISSPGVVNWTAHGLPINSKIRFRTTGALPTGIVANTDYFIISASYGANSFRIAATLNGSAINFTGSQSGVHTGVNSQFGVSNDLSTFTVPDLRGRVTAGLDSMGGTSANRLTGLSGGVEGDAIGNVGGAETHVLTIAQLAAHTHLNDPPNPAVVITDIDVVVNSGGAHTHTVTGTVDSGGAHTHTVTGTVDAGGAHTPAGTVNSGGAHVHTASAANESSHTHTSGTLGGVTDTEAAHTHADTFAFAGSLINDPHAHSNSGMEIWDGATGGGNHQVIQPISETGGIGPAPPTANNSGISVVGSITGGVSAGGAHSHTVDVNSGSTGAGTAHTHAITVDSGGAHTHTFTGTPVGTHTHTFSAGAAASAGAHTHTFSSGLAASGGAHTHTATATGTATATQADYASGSAGADGAHNNVQPTFIVRKLLYVG